MLESEAWSRRGLIKTSPPRRRVLSQPVAGRALRLGAVGAIPGIYTCEYGVESLTKSPGAGKKTPTPTTVETVVSPARVKAWARHRQPVMRILRTGRGVFRLLKCPVLLVANPTHHLQGRFDT